MTIEVSGVLTCEACNQFGCDKSTEVILVSGTNIFSRPLLLIVY